FSGGQTCITVASYWASGGPIHASVTGSKPGGSEQTRVASPPVRTTSHWTMQAARWLAHLPIAPAAASSHLKTRGSTIAAAGAASSATAMPSASAVVCLAFRAGGRSRGIGTTTPLPSRIPTSLRSRILGGGQSGRQEKFSAGETRGNPDSCVEDSADAARQGGAGMLPHEAPTPTQICARGRSGRGNPGRAMAGAARAKARLDVVGLRVLPYSGTHEAVTGRGR